MSSRFNFRREVINEFEKKTTFTKPQLATIYAILGIKFDEFIERLEKRICPCKNCKRALKELGGAIKIGRKT